MTKLTVSDFRNYLDNLSDYDDKICLLLLPDGFDRLRIHEYLDRHTHTNHRSFQSDLFERVVRAPVQKCSCNKRVVINRAEDWCGEIQDRYGICMGKYCYKKIYYSLRDKILERKNMRYLNIR